MRVRYRTRICMELLGNVASLRRRLKQASPRETGVKNYSPSRRVNLRASSSLWKSLTKSRGGVYVRIYPSVAHLNTPLKAEKRA